MTGSLTTNASIQGTVALTNSGGYLDIGRDVTPWDKGFEHVNYTFGAGGGWVRVNTMGFDVVNDTSYRGNYSFRLNRTTTSGSGGVTYNLTGTVLLGQTYTLTGYYGNCTNASNTFNIHLRTNSTAGFNGGATYYKVYSCNTTGWTYFSQSFTPYSDSVGDWIWLGEGLTNTTIIYFDELKLSRGLPDRDWETLNKV